MHLTMNTETLLPLVLDLLAKSSIVLLLAFAVQLLWRKASTAHRCLIWRAAFATLALLPLTVLVKPQWSLAVPPEFPVLVAPPMPAVSTAASLSAAPVQTGMDAPLSQSLQLPRWSAAQLGLGLWACGVVLLLGWRLLGTRQVRKLLRESEPLIDARIATLANRLAAQQGVSRRVMLRVSTRLPVPVTWGVFRPVVMLPEASLSWQGSALEAALLHELGHIRHRDALSRWGMTLVCAFFWPQVLVWLAARAWQAQQEQACDDLVLRSGTVREDYAMLLLDSARQMKHNTPMLAPVLAMAKPSTLETRLTAIMDETRDLRPAQASVGWMTGGMTVALLLACLALQVRAEDKPSTAGSDTTAIEITTQLIEAHWQPRFPILDSTVPSGGEVVQMTAGDSKDLVDSLTKKKGVSLLKPPVVVARSGQLARVKVVGDTRDKASKNGELGILLDFIPRLAQDGTLTVVASGEVKEINSFLDKHTRPILEYPVKPAIIQADKTTILAVEPYKSPSLHRRYLFLISARVIKNIEAKDLYDVCTLTLKSDGTGIESSTQSNFPTRTKIQAIERPIKPTDPVADQYFAAYMLSKSGEKLEEKSDQEGALQKYEAAQKAIQAIAKTHPEWQATMVAYRLKIINTAVAKLSASSSRPQSQ